MKFEVILSLGSNFCPEINIGTARNKIFALLEAVKESRIIWTEPVGIVSGKFQNMLLVGKTLLDKEQLDEKLKAIEREIGRRDEEKQAGIVKIDIDILMFDGKKFHGADWERPYVKELMSEL